jgi:hypothetical protein
MKPDPFETRLQSQPLRSIPPEWREEILSAAESASAEHIRPVRVRTRFTDLRARVAGMLWPSPVAWAGLTAVWLFTLSFKLATPATPRPLARVTEPPAAVQFYKTLRDQNQILTELISGPEPVLPARTTQFMPRPRSEACSRFIAV